MGMPSCSPGRQLDSDHRIAAEPDHPAPIGTRLRRRTGTGPLPGSSASLPRIGVSSSINAPTDMPAAYRDEAPLSSAVFLKRRDRRGHPIRTLAKLSSFGSQTGSQQRQTPGDARRHPATIPAAKYLIGRRQATSCDGSGVPSKRRVRILPGCQVSWYLTWASCHFHARCYPRLAERRAGRCADRIGSSRCRSSEERC